MKLRHTDNLPLALSALFAGILVMAGCSSTSNSSTNTGSSTHTGSSTTGQRTAGCTGAEQSSSRLFLQQVTANSAIVKWRGDAGALCAGKNINKLDIHAVATASSGDAAVDRGCDGDQRVEFVVADPDAAGLFDPVAGADLAAAGQGHREADEVLLALAE